MRSPQILKAGLLGCGWLMAGAANAAPLQTWTLVNSNCTLNCASSNTYREYKSDLNGILKIQALYSNNSSLDNNFQRRATSGTNGTSAVITSQDPNGIGLTNPRTGDAEGSSPNHAVDNTNNRDFLLLDFGQVMDLSSFSIGWKGGDSDMSFLYAPENWNMAASPIYAADGLSNGTSINDLIASSWTRQNYADVATNTTTNFVNGTYTTPIKSRYMLVSGSLSSTDDAFKFKTITGSAAPLPGTLALLGLGFGALVWSRRTVKMAQASA